MMSSEQYSNAIASIICNAFGSWIDFNVLHCKMVATLIEITDGGMMTLDTEEQSVKDHFSMRVINGGIVMLVSGVQELNALLSNM